MAHEPWTLEQDASAKNARRGDRQRRGGCSDGRGPATDVVRDGFVLDFISDAKQVKETPKELVRQRIARALFHEYGISVEDMAADFPVSVGGRRRRVDIAILGVGEAHEPENVQRVVVCRPEPKQNRRGAVKMRDYEQAAQDIAEVKPFFEEIEACRYALWTNGLEFFFLRRKATKFQVDAEPIGDWPPVDESIDDRNVLSRARAGATGRSGDAAHRVPPLPQFHPWQRRHAEGRGVLHGDGRRRQGPPVPPQLPGVSGRPPAGREVGQQGGAARIRRRRDDESALRVDDSDHRREHPPPLRSRACMGMDRGRRLSQHRATTRQRRPRDSVHRTLPRLAQAGRAHGHRPAGRDPRQSGRGVRPLVDPAPRWVLASVDLPVETFIVEANVNILTSLLFLKRKPDEVMTREAISGAADYPIFMAVAERVGLDRRGNTLYRRSPEGEEIIRTEEEPETVIVNGRRITRTLRRKKRIVDDDLPEIAKRYHAFRRDHPEPRA